MTKPRTPSLRMSAKAVAVFLLSAAFLSISFYTNVFLVANESLFRREITESFVMGRLVQSAQEGIFASAGLLGHGGPDVDPPEYSNEAMALQYTSYLEGRSFQSYGTYNSLIGGQGLFLGVVDRLLSGTPAERLEIHRAVASVLAAAALALIVVWFYLELGAVAGLFAFGSLALSSWLIAFAHNLYWSIWSFYLPMIALMYHLGRRGTVIWDQPLFFLIFGTVLLKCFLNGYEFITTFLIMMTVPLVFYRVRAAASLRAVVGDLTKAAVASVTAVAVSMVALVGQIAIVRGGLMEGLRHIGVSVLRRTYGDPTVFPELAASLEASLTEVLATYLMGPFFNFSQYVYTENPFLLRWVFGVRYVSLIGLFAIATVLLIPALRGTGSESPARALVTATWFSALAPLSWFVLFKSHSYQHPHMNFIVWQMPFTIFGFALCGLALRHLIGTIATRDRPASVTPAR